MQVNEERNRKIFEQWKLGSTIVETSLLLNIPMSTVGYYYKKFGKRPRNGVFYRSGVPETGRRAAGNEQETDISILAKSLTMKRILETLSKADFVETYYVLASIKLLAELDKYLRFTPEELAPLKEALEIPYRPVAQQAPPPHQIPEKKGKSLEDIFGIDEKIKRLRAQRQEM